MQTWIQATTYLQLVGILLGQLWFGFMGDWIGRKVQSCTVYSDLHQLFLLQKHHSMSLRLAMFKICCRGERCDSEFTPFLSAAPWGCHSKSCDALHGKYDGFDL